ncbi:hypothetical protein HHI36_009494 [Cryptolaemus montrouzieri]|uniref:Uncharacterized protein n=1 Tax=Cryptolaemus montrouzieri TaxID=559131 RepID=A0ABD2MFU5_9CUCU
MKYEFFSLLLSIAVAVALFDNEINLKCVGKKFENVSLTAYYPDYNNEDNDKGYQDKRGRKLRTLQDYIDDRTNYVTLAMDERLHIPYGTKACIPELNQHFGHRIFFLFAYNSLTITEAAIRAGSSIQSSTSKLKDITVAIEQNFNDVHSHNDSKTSSALKRSRANLVLNSKLIYPSGNSRAAAFNQGILRFQQLLDLPLNNSSHNHVDLKVDDDTTSEEVLDINKHNLTVEIDKNTQNSSVEETGDDSKISKKQFIEDFGTDREMDSNNTNETMKNDLNSTERTSSIIINKTLDVENIPSNMTMGNETKNVTMSKRSSIEILDDDDDENITNTTISFDKIGNQTSYLPSKQKSKSPKIIEIKPQKIQEIPLNLKHHNAASIRSEEEEKDEISQNIKRDILLGNLNPFFTNPSTSSIRNTNSVFFDDKGIPSRSSRLMTPTNPFIINSVALDTSKSGSFGSSTFAGFGSTSFGSSDGVETVPSISLKQGRRGKTSRFSRFRSKPSKPSATSVETLPSVTLKDGSTRESSFGLGDSKTSQKSTVRVVPSVSLGQENKKTRFSSKFKGRGSTAVSSTSFSFTPSVSKSRPSHGRPRTPISTPSISRPATKPANIPSSTSSNAGVEILKSVDYSLPEEVGKSLSKTGPAKFKRKVGFEPRKESFSINLEKSISVDPLTLNLDMSQGSENSMLMNAYLVNNQMKNTNSQYKRSRSFDFNPSIPDRETIRMREFSSNIDRNSLFSPSLQFQIITESPQSHFESLDKFEAMQDDYEKENDLGNFNNFESDVLFKPYFNVQSPKSFQIPESTTLGHIPSKADVHMIDLSSF